MQKWNNKNLDILALSVRPSVRVLALEGTIRSGKTATLTSYGFYLAVMESNEKYHCIAGRKLDIIRKNLLDMPNVGLIQVHKDVKLKKGTIGSSHLEINDPVRGITKEVALINYSNSSSWKDILGGTLGVIFIDEADIADPDFVREAVARQVSVDKPKLFLTSNGNAPTHSIYQEWYNYCKPIGEIPASTRLEMDEFQKKNGVKKGWYYFHCKMEDNPIMTPEKIALASAIYPVGSYYYKIKILGERGVPGNLLFEEYMTEELMVNAREEDERGRRKYPLDHFVFGVDIGADRACNSFCLIGYDKTFSKAIVLEMDVFQECGYDEKRERLFAFVDKCLSQWKFAPYMCDGILVDCAEQNFIADLKKQTYQRFHIDTVGSYKATIKERVDMMVIGFSLKRVLFNFNCREGYDSYRQAVASDKPNEVREDLNERKNDIMDSIEYGLTRHMKTLTAGGW